MSEHDKNLVAELQFDTKLIHEIRSYTDAPFFTRIGHSEAEITFEKPAFYHEFKEKNLLGLSFEIPKKEASNIIRKFQNSPNSEGYFIYTSQDNHGRTPNEITILKTDDKFDLLRFEGTNGINHDLYTEDVIERLKIWDKKYEFNIYAVCTDSIQAHYSKMPENLENHTQELYKFCPDIVNQGVETVEKLKQAIEYTEQLYLWWD